MSTESDTPFPLKKLFVQRIVPLLGLFVLAMVITTVLATKQVLEDIYLQMSQNRAAAMARGASRYAPQVWQQFLDGEKLDQNAIRKLADAFLHEEQEFHLEQLKVYNLDRVTLYSSDRTQIGKLELGAALQEVLETAMPLIDTKVEPNGRTLYELYVPYYDNQGMLKAVFELYEPITYLDKILLLASIPVVTVPGVLLIILVTALGVLINRAQLVIDYRTKAMIGLRNRLESLVSRSAVEAISQVGDNRLLQPKSVTCTLFFSDIRDFTGFSEQHTPVEVISFLNQLMQIQVSIIQSFDGDVDKMIGDAVFARFHGEHREKRAIAAAMEIQQALAQKTFPRGIGIGLYSGTVIAGGMGMADRLDYTVIGDSVNIAARLCAQAKDGELVCDEKTRQTAGAVGFMEPETISVKGRTGQLNIRRWKSVSAT
ncbi:MAG: adenylate/guanylate cyclase domain-containing protein [Magnetococcales bacterium]|nr:adenylate/guanylate cyclase domain-containing protein [Magnetococcales bacterium]